VASKETLRYIIGSKMRHYRGLLRISQEDLARLSGLNRSYIGGVERGERNIGVDNLERIAKGLGVDAWQLLYTDE
jgi:transcriptional regulator with XRE-family HTH domain